MDMRTREVTAFDALTNTEKLRIALFEASFRVPGEAGTKLLGLLSTTNLAIAAGVLAIWVGSHATPLGWVVDITMVGVGLIAIGAEAADVAQELCLFANGIIDASDEIQCRMAASHLARAVAIIGVDVVLAILLKKAVFTMKSRFKAPEAAPVPALPAQHRTTPSQASGRGEVPPLVPKGGKTGKVFTSTDPIVGETATSIDNPLPGAVRDVNVPIKNSKLNISSDADIQLANGDIIEVKSGGGTGATTQVLNQQQIIGNTGEVIVYGPNLKGSVIKGLQNKGFNVFTNMNELLNYIKSKGL